MPLGATNNPINEEANVAPVNINHNILFKAAVSLGEHWNNYHPQGAFKEDTLPSSFKFVITSLFALVAIKSQGDTKFPFHTHPQTVMLSVICVLMYGFASAAQHFFAVTRLSPNSVYAIVAHLGRMIALCILVACLVCLLSF